MTNDDNQNDTAENEDDEQLLKLQTVLGSFTDDERDEFLIHIHEAAEDSELTLSALIDICIPLACLGLDRRGIQQAIYPIVEYTSQWGFENDSETIVDYVALLLSTYEFNPEGLAAALETTDEACIDGEVLPGQIILAMEYCAPIAAHIGYPFSGAVSDISEAVKQGRHAAQVGGDLKKHYQAVGRIIATIEDEEL